MTALPWAVGPLPPANGELRYENRLDDVHFLETVADALKAEAVESAIRQNAPSLTLGLEAAADLHTAMAACLREGRWTIHRSDGGGTPVRAEEPHRLLLVSRLLTVENFSSATMRGEARTSNAPPLVQVVLDLRYFGRLADSLTRWNRSQFGTCARPPQELAEALLDEGYRVVGALSSCGR
ncbi:MAG: hypothetical protein ABL997_09920 [Planctomycetota bacterium]